MGWRGLVAVVVVVAAGLAVGAVAQSRYELLESDDSASAPSQPSTDTRTHVAPRREWRSPFELREAPHPLPVEVDFEDPPGAGILFDVETGEVLWQRNPERRLPIASLTKMLTGFLIAERHRPAESVAITPQALAYEGSGVGVLPKGGKVRLGALLRGLLLVSGNDAAIALAQHDAGTVGAFVRRMNRASERLGLSCSHFSSPHGLRDRDNYSCPRDLAALARADLATRPVRQIVGDDHEGFRFPVKGGFLDLYNNNPFIRAGMPGITGVKTGYTEAAGRCYVITARRGGRHLGVVLLDTPKPLDQVPALLRAGFKAEGRG